MSLLIRLLLAYHRTCGTCKPPLKEGSRFTSHHTRLKTSASSTIFRMSPSFLMFIRSISSSASLPKRRDVTVPVLLPPEAKISSLSRTNSDMLYSNLDIAWSFFIQKRDDGSIRNISARDLFDFAFRIGADLTIMKGCKDEDIMLSMQAGERLRSVLEVLGADRPLGFIDDYHWYCLEIISLALRGEFKLAHSQWTSITEAYTNDEKVANLRVLACHHILLCLWRHSSLLDAITFVIEDDLFEIFREHYFRGKVAASISAQLRSTFTTITEMVLSLESPLSLLTQLKSTHSSGDMNFIVSLMIRIFLRGGLVEDAYVAFTESEKQGLVLQPYLYMELVRHLTKEDMLYRANTLFSAIVPDDKIAQHYHATGLLLHSYQGRYTFAEEHFKHLLDMNKATSPDVNLLMQSHAISGHTKEVVEIFKRHLKAPHFNEEPSQPIAVANIYHYSEIIFAHAQAADFIGMNRWLERMGRTGIPPNSVVYNIILKSFVMRGDLTASVKLLEQMRDAGVDPDLLSYTTLISLLAKRRDPIGAEFLYKHAIGEGVSPDIKMISSVMNAHAEAGSWQGVVRAFDYLQSSRFSRIRLGIGIYNVLLKAYVLAGTPFSVVSRIYKRMEQNRVRPTGRTFALLIQSACDSGDMSAALRLLSEMDRVSSFWQNNLEIDVYVLTIIMSGFLRLGYRSQARSIYDEMTRRGIQPNSHTYAAILRSYANQNQGNIQIARDFLASITGVNKDEGGLEQTSHSDISHLEYMFTPLMDYYNKRLAAEEVETLVHDLELAGREASLVMLTILLDAYRRTANIASALELWPRVYALGIRYSNVHSLFQATQASEPEIDRSRRGPLLCIPLSIYIDLLSSSGYHQKVAEVWATLKADGFHFDAHNWNHLVVALVRAGELEHAFEIIEKVIIPYKEQSDAILIKKIRHRDPASPLYFGDEDEASANTLSLHETAHRRRRVKGHSYGVRNADGNISTLDVLGNIADDFAHPLHILHSMTPAWNSWRPHSLVLSILTQVLARLAAGGLIQPIKMNDNSEQQIENHSEDEAEEEGKLRLTGELAADILKRIHANYPKAVKAVLSWKLEQQFKTDYTQSDKQHKAH